MGACQSVSINEVQDPQRALRPVVLKRCSIVPALKGQQREQKGPQYNSDMSSSKQTNDFPNGSSINRLPIRDVKVTSGKPTSVTKRENCLRLPRDAELESSSEHQNLSKSDNNNKSFVLEYKGIRYIVPMLANPLDSKILKRRKLRTSQETDLSVLLQKLGSQLYFF